MLVRCEGTDLVLVYHLEGNLEQHTAPQFREAVTGMTGGHQVVLDLSAVPFVDSSGLGALIGSVRRIREMGGDVVLCSPRPSVNRVLKMVGLSRVVPVLNDVEEATRYFSGPAVA